MTAVNALAALSAGFAMAAVVSFAVVVFFADLVVRTPRQLKAWMDAVLWFIVLGLASTAAFAWAVATYFPR